MKKVLQNENGFVRMPIYFVLKDLIDSSCAEERRKTPPRWILEDEPNIRKEIKRYEERNERFCGA